MKKTILITGAAGFIGNVAWKRLEKKCKLIGIDNLSRDISMPPMIDSLQHHLFFHEDINNLDQLPLPLPPLDGIIHLAAQTSVVDSMEDPLDDLKSNIEGTLRLCMLAQKNNCKLIYASTNKVFGDLEEVFTPISDATPFDPATPYGVSKCAGAQYVLDMLPESGYVFHQSCIYGDTQVGTLNQGWIGWLKTCNSKGTPITCFGDGSQVRDLLHVEDLVDLYEMALEGNIAPGGYITGGGEENAYSFKEVTELLGCTISDYDDWRPSDQRYFVSSNEKLSVVGWTPKIKFLEWSRV